MLRLATNIVPFWQHAKMPPLLFSSLAMKFKIHDVPLGPLPIHFPPLQFDSMHVSFYPENK
jgi:hypothetical protein